MLFTPEHARGIAGLMLHLAAAWISIRSRGRRDELRRSVAANLSAKPSTQGPGHQLRHHSERKWGQLGPTQTALASQNRLRQTPLSWFEPSIAHRTIWLSRAKSGAFWSVQGINFAKRQAGSPRPTPSRTRAVSAMSSGPAVDWIGRKIASGSRSAPWTAPLLGVTVLGDAGGGARRWRGRARLP